MHPGGCARSSVLTGKFLVIFRGKNPGFTARCTIVVGRSFRPSNLCRQTYLTGHSPSMLAHPSGANSLSIAIPCFRLLRAQARPDGSHPSGFLTSTAELRTNSWTGTFRPPDLILLCLEWKKWDLIWWGFTLKIMKSILLKKSLGSFSWVQQILKTPLWSQEWFGSIFMITINTVNHKGHSHLL